MSGLTIQAQIHDGLSLCVVPLDKIVSGLFLKN